MKVLAWPAFRNSEKNPYNGLLYTSVMEATDQVEVVEFGKGALSRLREFDILHIHWPDAFVNNAGHSPAKIFLRCRILFALLDLARLGGARIVWTAHNFKRGNDAGAQATNRFLWGPFLRRVHGVIFMTEVSRKAISGEAPEIAALPQEVIPHGDYSLSLPRDLPDVDHVGLQYFGSITPYKNVSALVKAFGDIPAEAAPSLRISARNSRVTPDPDFLPSLAALSPEARARCLHEDAFQSDADLCARVTDSDLVVLPYRMVMNSGSAIYALTCGTPILAPRIPLFEELQAQVGADWVILFDGALTGETLLEAWQSAAALKAAGAAPDLSPFHWPSLGAQTVAFYRRVMGEA